MTAPGPQRDHRAIEPPVRIRAQLWLRLMAPALTTAAATLAVLAIADHDRRAIAAVALAVLCGLVTVLTWWGEVAVDAQRLSVRVVQRDATQILAIDLVRIVGVNEAAWWRGGSTLVVQDATGRTLAIGAGYFPLPRVWAELRRHLESNPEVVVDPSVNVLVR